MITAVGNVLLDGLITENGVDIGGMFDRASLDKVTQAALTTLAKYPELVTDGNEGLKQILIGISNRSLPTAQRRSNAAFLGRRGRHRSHLRSWDFRRWECTSQLLGSHVWPLLPPFHSVVTRRVQRTLNRMFWKPDKGRRNLGVCGEASINLLRDPWCFGVF